MPFMEEISAFSEYETVFILRLSLAVLLGGIIGMERQFRNAAGFRTHILVAVGSCLFTTVSVIMPMIASQYTGGVVNNADPSRISAQVVSGIGFLGAGAILHGKNNVYGLTTAASLWIVAAIGLACGVGLYATAIFATVITLIVLRCFYHIEDKADAIRARQKLEQKNKGKIKGKYNKDVCLDFSDLADLLEEAPEREK